MIKSINQIVAFALEIIMLVTYGYFGMTRPWNLIVRLLFTILVISLAVLLWSKFAAPKSGQRLKMPYLALFRAAMFLVAAFFLFQTGHKNLAFMVTGVIIITQLVSYFTER